MCSANPIERQVCQKGCEDLAVMLWTLLRVDCRYESGQKELLLDLIRFQVES